MNEYIIAALMAIGIIMMTFSLPVMVKLQFPILSFAMLFGGLFLFLIAFGFLIGEPKQTTGEIVKIYVNGTALLDNGTLVKLSDIRGFGCVR